MISAKIIADSISEAGDRIVTWELQYPRFIHSEFMTHRVFSRNAASSRAIPVETLMKMIEVEPAMPEEWGKNQAGMQAKEVFSSQTEVMNCEWMWVKAAKSAVAHAKEMQEYGIHKQIANRVLEPFVHMKTVVTATEWDNFWWLRCHTDAQPEIRILAEKMYKLYKDNTPRELKSGEWHMPYVDFLRDFGTGEQTFYSGDYEKAYVGEETLEEYTLEEALKISASCCAQVSFRKSDDSLDKAVRIYDRLVTSEPVHASPLEHQATPMDYFYLEDMNLKGDTWPEGITHVGQGGEKFWSGNFKGWIQNRQLISGNTCWNYEESK